MIDDERPGCVTIELYSDTQVYTCVVSLDLVTAIVDLPWPDEPDTNKTVVMAGQWAFQRVNQAGDGPERWYGSGGQGPVAWERVVEISRREGCAEPQIVWNPAE